MAKNGNTSNNKDKNRTEQSINRQLANQKLGNQQSRQNARNTSVEFSEEFCCENDSRKSQSCDNK